jgi:pheromone shutdown-related protein TraB
MRYKNIVIIGTSHIAKESLKEIEEKFIENTPGIVAVELDRKRLNALMSEEKRGVELKSISRIGLKGYLFAVIGGYIQKKLGNVVGIKPGSEMKLAVKLAGQTKTKIALIDQDIEITLTKFSQRLTWKEKLTFAGDIINSIVRKKKMLKELGIEGKEIDLNKVPGKELIKKLLIQMEKKYPNLYDVLVKQRNKIMANNILKLVKKYPEEKILVVIGAGHEEGIMELVKKGLEGKVDVV